MECSNLEGLGTIKINCVCHNLTDTTYFLHEGFTDYFSKTYIKYIK